MIVDGPVPRKKNPIEDALKVLGAAMRDDDNYRYGWQANLAMMMVDEGVDHDKANDRANSFIKMVFDA